MPFTLTIVKDLATMNGALTVDRGDFGVGQGQFASPDTVARNVAVMVRLAAKSPR
jgi:polyisoprenoid-binding protein YceI